ncbi:MAG: hypothetical protein Q8K65_02805 [Alphaproteobacteria bacterium]|nr:hypothetical protein [Alphaproteobacteria bacterium]
MVEPVKKEPAEDRELRDCPKTDPTPARDLEPAPARDIEPAPARDIEKEEAQRAQLGEQLKTVDGWMENLHDPERGGVGKAFLRATEHILRSEDLDFQMKPSAGYHSFIYPPKPEQDSFSNYVLYGIEALENAARLMGARTHEFVHALQYQSAAALHADPFNDATHIIVSPYDYVLRKERLEQDAYVKGAWLCSLAVGDAPEIVKAMQGSPLPIDTFQKIRSESASLQDAFEAAARACRNLLGVWAKDAEKSVIADEWHERALEEYDLLLKYRFENLQEGEALTLVLLEGPDILEIGASFGPNTFGADAENPALTEIENLSPANAKKLAEIEKKYGIAPRAELPTVDDALAAASTTRAAFIDASRNHKGAPAKPVATVDAPKAANDTTAPARQQNTGPRPPAF